MRLVTRILAPLALLLAMFVPAGAASAAPADSERFETIAFDINFCNGEFVVGQADVHTVTKQQKDGSYIFHFNLHGQGTGSQGNEYVMNSTIKTESSSTNYSYDSRFMAISKGSAPNQVISVHYDNGNYTFQPECRG